MKHSCIGCGLRYSSYCMGCEMKLFGIGALPIPGQEPRRQKSKDANENGQTCIISSNYESLIPEKR